MEHSGLVVGFVIKDNICPEYLCDVVKGHGQDAGTASLLSL